MALTLEITMSLDGFVAGPNPSLEDPLGKRGEELHEWAFAAQAWREAHGLEGGEANADSDVIDEPLARTGATIMGRKMFSGGDGPVGRRPERERLVGRRPAVPSPRLRAHPPRARAARRWRHDLPLRHRRHRVRARAGARRGRRQGRRRRRRRQAVRQYLAAGLLDEMQIHVAPMLLGDGDAAASTTLSGELELVRTIASPAVTHLRYRVVK